MLQTITRKSAHQWLERSTVRQPPDADAYIEVGQNIEVGQTLCIIEAMKLMNEIESDFAGKIAEIVVENAQPVEYNQVLFLIEK